MKALSHQWITFGKPAVEWGFGGFLFPVEEDLVLLLLDAIVGAGMFPASLSIP